MAHIMYVGPVGAGKTYCAVADAVEDDGDFIITNQPLDPKGLDAAYGLDLKDRDTLSDQSLKEAGTKAVKEYADFESDEFKSARCGALVIDEAPLFMDARKWDRLSDQARDKIIEHRKDDLVIYSTAQHVSFIDKIYRIMTEEVRLVEKRSLPLIGWIWPHSVRPTIICKDCAKVMRDAVGDDYGWRRWLGFGTYYRWRIYSPTILGAEQDITGRALAEENCLGTGRRLFDRRLAAVYKTTAKLSKSAKEYRGKRRTEFYSASESRKSSPQHILPFKSKKGESDKIGF